MKLLSSQCWHLDSELHRLRRQGIVLACAFASCFVSSASDDGFVNDQKNKGTKVEEGVDEEVGVGG